VALAGAVRVLVCGLLFLTVFAVLMPFNPNMPASGLDPSWVFSMNQAVSQGLVFGKQIVFTYGPFASISTKMYHPATYHLMMYGGFFVAVCYGTALLFFCWRGRSVWMLLLGAFIASFLYLDDALFLSYPLILAGIIFGVVQDARRDKQGAGVRPPLPVLVVLFSALGMLPLVKASFALNAAVISLLCFAVLWRNGLKRLAYCVIISPVAAVILFWLMAGQPLLALPVYAWRTAPMISGYSEAMAMAVDSRQVWLYLLASVCVLWMVGTLEDTEKSDRLFLIASFGIFLFLAFKAGFVRHDGHAITSGDAIVIGAILAAFLPKVRNAGNVFVVAVLAWALIDGLFVASSTRSFFKNITSTYKIAVNGIRKFDTGGHELEATFHQRMEAIGADAHIPRMDGTSDIYSAQQTDLIAAGNRWNPRPVIQSYAVFTPSLAGLNESHLYGSQAPDHLVFRIEPIDGRLPSLEDGVSWFAMMQNYVPVKMFDRFVYLDKRGSGGGNVTLDALRTETGELDRSLALPNSARPLFAELEIRPTLFGRLVAFLYKPSQLKITLELESGEKKEYRIISGMAKSAFLISPLVDSNETFAMLQADRVAPAERRVKSIRISAANSPSLLWRSQYELRLFAVNETNQGTAQPRLFDKVEDLVAMEMNNPVSVTCDVGMDELNGSPGRPASSQSKRVLVTSGWLAVSAKDGIGPEDIYVTLTDEQGKTRFLKTQRTSRMDAKTYFKHPEMPDIGFGLIADVSDLKGNYEFGMGRKYNGQIGKCSTPVVPIVMSGGTPQGR
jgi:hypothetical protein